MIKQPLTKDKTRSNLRKDGPINIKVTTINGNHHCRLFLNGKLYSEMACKNKKDISYCIRELLRWYDKLGFPYSKMASASRHRGKNLAPSGKIWKVNIEK